MGIIGHASPIASKIIGSAKSSISKSNLEIEWEELLKNEKQVNRHVKILSLVYSNSLDESSLAKLLKKD